MKKWIILAGVVFLALGVALGVMKPWRHGTPISAEDAEAMAQLQAVNERAKEASRKLMELSAAMQPFDPKTQRPPFPGQGSPEGEAPAAEAGEGHKHGESKRDPADLARHEKANDVVKATAIGLRGEAVTRPDAAPRWDAVAALEWKRLDTLFTGFSIGYKVGGDFTKEVVGELHGAAVEIEGAVLPIDPPKGALKRFWLVKPAVAEAACAFCKAPSPGESIYVDASKTPLKLDSVDKKKMYEDVFIIKAVGRFLLGPTKTKDGIEYLYGLELKEWK